MGRILSRLRSLVMVQGKELLLRKGGDIGRHGSCMELLWNGGGNFGMIRKWSDVLQCRILWHSCINQSCVGGVQDCEGRFRCYIGV